MLEEIKGELEHWRSHFNKIRCENKSSDLPVGCFRKHREAGERKERKIFELESFHTEPEAQNM